MASPYTTQATSLRIMGRERVKPLFFSRPERLRLITGMWPSPAFCSAFRSRKM